MKSEPATTAMKSNSKSAWIDPAKRPPKPETMNTPGDFGKFTELMKRVVKVRLPREEKPTSASPGPAVS
jgi:hypothetical protein